MVSCIYNRNGVINMAKPSKKYSNLTKEQINYVKKELGIKKIEDIDTTILKQLKEALKGLKDTRNQNMIIYKLWDVIICVIIASFGFNNTWEEIHDFVDDNYEWFKSFLQMTGGIPTAESYERIMSLVDENELNKILFDFFNAITLELKPDVKMLNFDGRVNNGSKRNSTLENEEKRPLNCLNVYSNEYGYCICTKAISEKTNEIPTIEELIEGMNLNGVIVTWDALNSQTANVKAVIKSKGDYTIPIKGNQGVLHQDLALYFDVKRCEQIIAGNSNSEYLTYTEKSHSSIIKYEYFQTSDIDWYDKKNEWEKMHTMGLVRKTITKKVVVLEEDKKKKVEKIVTTIENRYYISSKYVDIAEFNTVTRGHWNIENKIHWHLDFTFCQDDNRTTNKKALLNLEIIHKFVLGVLERVKSYYGKSLQRIRKHISNDIEKFFPELLCYLIVG